MSKAIHCIGVMSGTSIDGVDIAHCSFEAIENKWQFQIHHADCLPYSELWQNRLVKLHEQSAEVFAKTNVYYGHFLGQCVQQFIKKYEIQDKFSLVSSHGQTIFHNPSKGYTIQIGHGAAIAKECGLPVVCDLRTSDMAYGGQGAPIVPLGEKFLFPNLQQFVNIGGISNCSLHTNEQTIGYDVCMGNLLLDELASRVGKAYDNNGEMAASGAIHKELLADLNAHSYFAKSYPKSLDAEEVLNEFLPLVDAYSIPIEDQMATIVEHIAVQLSSALHSNYKTMVTGGGALNSFLVKRLQSHFSNEIILPETEIIENKEALIIAFLGLLRLNKQENVLASVTGANKNTINGALYLP